MKSQNKEPYAFGMIGLGTMGANFLQNIADNGYSCAGFDVNKEKVQSLNDLGRANIRGFSDMESFTNSLDHPRIVMLLVPAGKIVDSVIANLTPHLSKGDIIIDGGNSHFTDTERRFKELEAEGLKFIGMGVSGGEEGARRGPSMMPGGDKQAYETLRPILEKTAAKVNGEPTVAFMGERSAGHFVKMVHNGIEYALMQLLAETYDIFRKGLNLSDADIHLTFKKWNEGRLQSYLMEITRDIFAYRKKGADHILLNDIKDEAKAKGTGKWTSQAAMDLSLPVPLIDISVAMRDLSKYKDLRIRASRMFDGQPSFNSTTETYIPVLEKAFFFAMATAYAQGMHLLTAASREYDYKLNPGRIAKIWRGGCIIRSSFLETIYAAYEHNPDLEHLFMYEPLGSELKNALPGLRKVVSDAASGGVPVPAFSAALSYFDAFRSENMPANLIQAQRDYFGSHTYELRGKEGVFHTEWESGGVKDGSIFN